MRASGKRINERRMSRLGIRSPTWAVWIGRGGATRNRASSSELTELFDFHLHLTTIMAARSEPLSIESLLQKQREEKEAAAKVCVACLGDFIQ